MSEPFIGEIRIFAGNFAPRNWAFCDGQLLPVAQNTALFAILGTIYGGNGRTDFAVPNLQGRAAMHAGNGPGLTPRQLGQTTGVETVTLTEAQMAQHSHGLQGSGPASTNSPAGAGPATAPAVRQYHATGNLVDASPDAVSTDGAGAAHNNMQPYLALNFIIAVQGVFPTRS